MDLLVALSYWWPQVIVLIFAAFLAPYAWLNRKQDGPWWK